MCFMNGTFIFTKEFTYDRNKRVLGIMNREVVRDSIGVGAGEDFSLSAIDPGVASSLTALAHLPD